jgi:hypothetical protein
MADLDAVANFNGLRELNTTIWDASAVPNEVWDTLQQLHKESIRSHLPREDWDRADLLTRQSDPDVYRASRVNPNSLVGHEFRADQLFRRVMVAITHDTSGEPISAMLTANNASASLLPERLRPAEYWAKMMTPPAINIPIIGGKRYVHIRETYTHPDAQKPFEVPHNILAVGGLSLINLYFSLMQRRPEQPTSAYYASGDPADNELRGLTRILKMHITNESPMTAKGYDRDSKLVRVQEDVRQLLENIIRLPGAAGVLNPRNLNRITNGAIRLEKSRIRREAAR